MLDDGDVGRAHRELHREFTWQPDMKTFGQVDFWDRPVKRGDRLVGDCDDWSIELWHRLGDLGVRFSDRRLAICRVDKKSRAQDHCVLAYRSMVSGSWLISCCNEPELKRWDHLPYDMWLMAPEISITDPWQPFS